MFPTGDTKIPLSTVLCGAPHFRLILYYEGLCFNYTGSVSQWAADAARSVPLWHVNARHLLQTRLGSTHALSPSSQYTKANWETSANRCGSVQRALL